MHAGTQLGHYTILSALGKGGMGEVWRARDTRLNREVAIKTLPQEFSLNTERLARFEREATLLASLNHPNIAAVYGLEEHTGSRLLVMELVEGETLAERLSHGAIPVEESLRLAHQIAEALEAAHDRGVIHRDLKPANIKITPEGKVKVLDFGLAKALEGSERADPSNSPTLSIAATQPGVILGTAAYMSPEQAKGRSTDKRTDIWSFGCVLFEMLCGRPPFSGDDVSDIMASVLKTEPEWTRLPNSVAPRLRETVERCLAKDPKKRFRDIGDVLLELERIEQSPTQSVLSGNTRPQRRGYVAIGIVAIGALVLLGLVGWYRSSVATEQAPLHLNVELPPDQIWMGINGSGVVISPDGRTIAYLARTGESRAPAVYLRSLNEFEARLVPGSNEGYSPFFSPDGTEIGFIAMGKLWRAATSGGKPIEIGPVDPLDRGAFWAEDGFIYSGGATGVSRIPVSGGEREALTKVNKEAGEGAHRFPEVLPGGEALLFTVFKGDLDAARVALLDLKTRQWRVLMDQPGHLAKYSPTGHLVYLRQGILMAVGFDISRLETIGLPNPVIDGIRFNDGGAAHFDLSDNGSLVYIPAEGANRDLSLTWVDRQGKEEKLMSPPGNYQSPAVSPDGARLAIVRTEMGETDIWIWDFARANFASRLSRPVALEESLVWMPDGQSVVFSSRIAGVGSFADLFRWPTSGTTPAQQIGAQGAVQPFGSGGRFPTSITSDGSKLFLTEASSEPGIRAMNMKTSAIETVLPGRAARDARLSPDGRWLALEEEGQIFVRPVTGIESQRWPVSGGPATSPRWAPNGRELFFLAPNGVMAVSIEAGAVFRAGLPRALFAASNFSPEFDVSRDGRRFLMLKRPANATDRPSALRIIVNWPEEALKRKPVR